MIHKVDDEQRHLKQQSTPSAITTSSPTHEFSFTTLQPPPPPPPADDIFFHGHLLPLHPIPDSPRTSNNSLDSFTLPINLLFGNTSFHCHHETISSDDSDVTTINPSKPKSKSSSILPKWNKRSYDNNECEVKEKSIRQLIKRYMKMVKSLLFLPKNHRSYSLSVRRKAVEMSKRRGELSAPASMRASPANSGILVASSGCTSPIKIRSESSMEELHAAIQAAIAHCKNSIAN